MTRIGFVSLALVTAFTVGCDRKSESSTVGTAGTTDVGRRDKDFVRNVALLNMAEVELGNFALSRGTDLDVKKFAEMMIDDHTKAGVALKAVASQYNIEVPSRLDDKHQRLRDKLAARQGLEFEREYMEAMVDGHQEMIDKLEPRIDTEALRAWKTEMADKLSGKVVIEQGALIAVKPEKSDEPVRMALNNWAAATYPVVQTHLTGANMLLAALKKKTTD